MDKRSLSDRLDQLTQFSDDRCVAGPGVRSVDLYNAYLQWHVSTDYPGIPATPYVPARRPEWVRGYGWFVYMDTPAEPGTPPGWKPEPMTCAAFGRIMGMLMDKRRTRLGMVYLGIALKSQLPRPSVATQHPNAG